MKKGGLFAKAVSHARYVTGLKIPLYASHASFFIVLATFPALVLLVSLLRYTGLEVAALTGLLEGLIPDALLPGAKRLILTTYRSTTGTVVSLSAVTALWSASRSFQGICTGLNSIYGVREDRGYLRTRLMSMVYTVLFLVLLVLTLVLQVFGNGLSRWQPVGSSGLWQLLQELLGMRFFVLLFLQTLVFMLMFMFLPNRKNRFWDGLPGAVLASGGWLIFSDLYSVYVTHFAGLSDVYGSVYVLALSLLWLYWCISIFFYGGALNHSLEITS